MLRPPVSPLEWAVYGLAVWGLAAVLWEAVRLVRGAALARRGAQVSFLLLARNQEQHIEGVIRWLATLRQARGAPFDLVVVDQGSTDGTARIVERLARDMAGIKLVRAGDHLCRGQGACELGLFACQHRVVVCLDLTGLPEVRPLLQTVSALVGEGGHSLGRPGGAR